MQKENNYLSPEEKERLIRLHEEKEYLCGVFIPTTT